MYICMTKVISISDEAYDALKKLKHDLSFSKIIIEITREKRKEDIMDYAGILDEETAEMMKEVLKERKIASRRLK